MNKKLSDAINSKIKKELTLTFGSEQFIVNLERLTINHLVQYESEGLDVDSLFSEINKKKITWITRLAFDLFDKQSKDLFGSLEEFRSCIGIDDSNLIIITEAISGVLTESQPKNGESEPQ